MYISIQPQMIIRDEWCFIEDYGIMESGVWALFRTPRITTTKKRSHELRFIPKEQVCMIMKQQNDHELFTDRIVFMDANMNAHMYESEYTFEEAYVQVEHFEKTDDGWLEAADEDGNKILVNAEHDAKGQFLVVLSDDAPDNVPKPEDGEDG